MQIYQHSVDVEILLPDVGYEVAQLNNSVVEINSDSEHFITAQPQESSLTQTFCHSHMLISH